MRRVEAGEIVIYGFNASKIRPWLVLWVDDDRGEVGVAAYTTQADAKAVIVAKPHPALVTRKKSYIASWVTVQDVERVAAVAPVGCITRTELRDITAQLRVNMGLNDD